LEQRKRLIVERDDIDVRQTIIVNISKIDAIPEINSPFSRSATLASNATSSNRPLPLLRNREL